MQESTQFGLGSSDLKGKSLIMVFGDLQGKCYDYSSKEFSFLMTIFETLRALGKGYEHWTLGVGF